MHRTTAAAWTCLVPLTLLHAPTAPAQPVGPQPEGGSVTPTFQIVRPAGESLELPTSRPVDLVLSPDARWVFLKDNHGLLAVDASTMAIVQRLPFPDDQGGSMTGLAITRDGTRLLATDSASTLHEATVSPDGHLAWSRHIQLPPPTVGGKAFACGIALSPDELHTYVCLSRDNALAIINLQTAALERTIPVGVAPYAVTLSPDGAHAYVTNWGGRRPRDNEPSANSAGTPALIDPRGIASSGTLSIIDLHSNSVTHELEVGLSPSDLVLSPDASTLYLASANTDELVVIDTHLARIDARVLLRPDDALPFGSMPSALALSDDRTRLYAANAGNNALAVLELQPGHTPTLAGFIPTGWLPGAIAEHQGTLFVANIRGTGSRQPRADHAFNSHRHTGTLQRLPSPSAEALAGMTSQCLQDARVPQALRAIDRARPDIPPTPVPANPGEPSVFEHVIYIIKENRTYDQVYGDLASPAEGSRGNGAPALCIYGRNITPNQHALADQFALLDNYYCNGVLSADGHSWATEGNVTPYLERSFGGFSRSYTFGDDPLTYSSSGFIWDHVLAAGLSFRNYGEFDDTTLSRSATLPEVWHDWQSGNPQITFRHNIGVETMRRYSCPDSPGWNLDIPDQIRADVFLRELEAFERDGTLPNLVIIYLPNDHTSGTSEGSPTPSAQVADNDLALGRIVDALSHSRFWPSTCIFVNEDDPQNGWDHVDGHRSTCLVISPYTRRGSIVSDFYNQAGVVHTIERILGIPGANQRYLMAPVMHACFTDQPDTTPFNHLPSNVEITEMNPARRTLAPDQRHWAELSATIDFDRVDAADEDTLNRILWHAAMGTQTPYPADWAGAHGRGLAALGLAPHERDDNLIERMLESAWGIDDDDEVDDQPDDDEPLKPDPD